MRHSDHDPGTHPDCPDCARYAYQPGWYKALRDERVLGKRHDLVLIPEAALEEPRPVPVIPIPEVEPDDTLVAVPQLANLRSVFGHEDQDEGWDPA